MYSWKLSRTKQLTPAANVLINTAMESVNVLENRYYEVIDQSNDACFYLPDYIPGQPVEFPGTCDENINVIQNFNAERVCHKLNIFELLFIPLLYYILFTL